MNRYTLSFNIVGSKRSPMSVTFPAATPKQAEAILVAAMKNPAGGNPVNYITIFSCEQV